MRVLVIKDEEGILRPSAGIWPIEREYMKRAVVQEWEANISRKKAFQVCSLVEAELKEVA